MTDPLCNLCGEPCGTMENVPELEFVDAGLIECKVHGSYHSTPGTGHQQCGALDDMTTYTFSLCEFCLDWLFTKFVTPPKVNPYSLGSGRVETDYEESKPFRPAEQRVREDEWRQFKDVFFKEAAKRNERRK